LFGLFKLIRDYDLDFEDFHPTHDGQGVFVICSDFFYWGTADGEEFGPDDLPLMRECAKDLKEAGDYTEVYTTLLYCARRRGMRPQRSYFRTRESGYKVDTLNPAARALFDACGPAGSDVDRG
jgi:hypothetical protein